MTNAYRQTVSQVEKELGTNSSRGLSTQEVQRRLSQTGKNVLPVGKRETWVSIFLSQFQSPLIYILLVAAVIIFFVGEHRLDAFILSGVLFFNALVGTIQEGRTSNIMESLRRFVRTKSVVIREGKHEIIPDEDLVPGDLIVLKEGERVPADARIVTEMRLQIDEAILTGESTPVYKTDDPLDSDARVANQTNMIFRGTSILSGTGTAIVVATGAETEIGKLHKTIEEINTDIPLKKELNRLAYMILGGVLLMCVGLLIVGLLFGRPFQELAVMLTALFICVIPEGLPVVLTLVLVTGAYRMAQKNVLIRNLQGVEALGRTDVIVIDKTGTLTRNEMMVTRVVTKKNSYTVSGEGYFPDGDVYENGKVADLAEYPSLEQMGVAAELLNSTESSFNKKLRLFDIKGDPTELALSIFAQKLGMKEEVLESKYQLQYEIPFDSKRKYHAAFYKYDGKCVVYLIGAPEIVFERAADVSDFCKKGVDEFLKEGLRTVAIASKECEVGAIPAGKSQKEQFDAYEALLENGLTILGLCGIQDSIRKEVAQVIDKARDVGMHIIMATGDHKDTALYVAKKVGIFKEGDEVLTGQELQDMSDDQLLQQLNRVTVFARVNPKDKARIIDLLHQQHKIVAMTGDGVNDVPSLLAADLGIAMGGIGTEVTKQAADLVLLDDSFVNIISAIEQGRHIFYTLRRVVLYFFATNMGEILIVLIALFTNLPLPLTASQILWLNFVTDGFLDIGLSMEPPESDLLQAEWLKKKVRLVDMSLLIKTMYFAIPMGLTSLALFSWAYDGTPASIPYARTMTLIAMAMFQWFNAWNCRSEQKSLFTIGLFSNKWLVAATALVLALQFAIVYVPFMQYIFKTVPLSFSDWAIIVCVSFPLLVVEEIRKLISRWWYARES
jgi:P-type Ca2+ transporter type 2C